MKLKYYVQDLIDRKEITVGAQTSPNAGLQIYQNVFPPHNNNKSGKGPIQNNNNNQQQNKSARKNNATQDYTTSYLDYGSLIGCISEKKPSINVINIQGPSNECAVTTRRVQFNIASPPVSSAPSAPSKSQYNILERLGNMPAQISILDLLRTSPVYKDILDSALIESSVPSNINATDFRNLVGHLSSSCALSFKPTAYPWSSQITPFRFT